MKSLELYIHSSPVVVRFFSIMVLCVLAVSLSDPVYIAGLGGVVSVLIVLLHGGRELSLMLKGCLILCISIVVINVCVSPFNDEATILWQIWLGDMLGFFIITKESLILALTMSLKFTVVMICMVLGGCVISSENVFSLLSYYLPRVALVTSIGILVVPRIKRRMADACDVLKLRGHYKQANSFYGGISALAVISRVLILSLLEDAWATSEALEARAYGATKRTDYRHRH